MRAVEFDPRLSPICTDVVRPRAKIASAGSGRERLSDVGPSDIAINEGDCRLFAATLMGLRWRRPYRER